MKNASIIIIAVLLVALLLPFTIKMTSYAIGRVGLSVPIPMFAELKAAGIDKAMYGGRITNISDIPWLICLNITSPIGLFISIPGESKEIYPGDMLNVGVNLILPEPFTGKDIEIIYSVIDLNDVTLKILYSEHEIKRISGSRSFIKQIPIGQEMTPGSYIVAVEMSYKNKRLMQGWDVFKIKEKREYRLILPKEFRSSILLAATLLLDIFVAVIIFALIRRIRHKQ